MSGELPRLMQKRRRGRRRRFLPGNREKQKRKGHKKKEISTCFTESDAL